MKKESRRTNKYLLLAIIMIAVFVLPGCRTRITNNSEVSNIQYDEDGYLTETYQMRRDELGLSTAERPILPDFGSGETDDNDDFSEGESIEYNPEDYEEDFTEPETTTNTNTNTNTNTTTRSTTRRTTNTTPSRRSTNSNTTTKVKVTFNANGGKVTENNKETFIVSVKKGAAIGTLPKATRDGYTLEGWYTEKTGGSKIDAKVKASSPTTVYAHWKEEKPAPAPVKTHKIVLNGDDGSQISSEDITEGKQFTLPQGPRVSGFDFIGWSTTHGGSKEYDPGEKITVTSDLSLFAVYKQKDPEGYWQDMFDDASKKEKKYNVAHGDGEDTKVIQDSGGKSSSADNADVIIGFVAEEEDAEQVATDLKTTYNKKVLVIPKATNKLKGAERVLYEIYMLNAIQENDVLKIEDAENDLDVGIDSLGIIQK